MNLFQSIASDYQKYKKYGGNFASILFFTQGFWAVFQYRIANFIYRNVRLIGVRQFLLFICLFWQKIIEIITGISIPASVKIGHSFYIGHFGGIIINANAEIGNDCNISQGVTIGVSGLNEKRGVPKIGNNVYLGANCVIAGKIYIGDDVLVGACSLIVKDVASSSVMSGVPADMISSKGSKGYI
jgi:serine O-acetyltransferase